jgi:hypothetical protein
LFFAFPCLDYSGLGVRGSHNSSRNSTSGNNEYVSKKKKNKMKRKPKKKKKKKKKKLTNQPTNQPHKQTNNQANKQPTHFLIQIFFKYLLLGTPSQGDKSRLPGTQSVCLYFILFPKLLFLYFFSLLVLSLVS